MRKRGGGAAGAAPNLAHSAGAYVIRLSAMSKTMERIYTPPHWDCILHVLCAISYVIPTLSKQITKSLYNYPLQQNLRHSTVQNSDGTPHLKNVAQLAPVVYVKSCIRPIIADVSQNCRTHYNGHFATY